MSQKKTFLDRLSNFFFGEPIPALSNADLQLVRDLHQKLDTLSATLDSSPARPDRSNAPSNGDITTPVQAEMELVKPDRVDELTEQLRKLAKTQFKANTLQESQLAQQQAAIETLQKAVDQQEKLLAELSRQREQAVAAAQLELLKTLLPVLDSLDAAFNSGRRQIRRLPLNQEARQAMIAWLDGIRLARVRLVDLLAAYDIQPIPTVGQPFDPRYHIAVAVDNSGQTPDGMIVSEDRPGYASPTRILREAEVVVARSQAAT